MLHTSSLKSLCGTLVAYFTDRHSTRYALHTGPLAFVSVIMLIPELSSAIGWLAGFTDGEGNFGVNWSEGTYLRCGRLLMPVIKTATT